jgi:hypothetical protein
MSARHEAFDKIVEFLNTHSSTFNAPYGILAGKVPGRGRNSVICYNVTFGISRYMDATITVYTEHNITLDSSGSHTDLNGNYLRADSLINVMKRHFQLDEFSPKARIFKPAPVKSGIPSVPYTLSELVPERGDTRTSLRNADYLLRAYGKPVRIELINGEDTYGVLAIWKGTMHLFTGFSWGYTGEGPSGLDEFLHASGVWRYVIAKNIVIPKNDRRVVLGQTVEPF